MATYPNPPTVTMPAEKASAPVPIHAPSASMAAFPEDEFQDAPQLVQDLEDELMRREVPFGFFAVSERESSFEKSDPEQKVAWLCVLGIPDKAGVYQPFTVFWGGEKFRNIKLRRIMRLINEGAERPFGPFILRDVETENTPKTGNMYRKLIAVASWKQHS